MFHDGFLDDRMLQTVANGLKGGRKDLASEASSHGASPGEGGATVKSCTVQYLPFLRKQPGSLVEA